MGADAACCKEGQREPQIGEYKSEEELFFEYYPLVREALIVHKYSFKDIDRKKVTTFQEEGIFLGDDRKTSQSRGIMMYNNGFYYVGDWKKNKREGQGMLVDKNGCCYRGSWKDNGPHGKGQYFSFDEQERYIGDWENGIQHGKGTEIKLYHYEFTGDFVEGRKQGNGTIKFQDGTRFEGAFKNNLVDGQGTLTSKNFKYKGSWKQNLMNGIGMCEFQNAQGKVAEVYIGFYKDGQKSDYGEYRWGNDAYYKGTWERGEMSDVGVVVYKKESSPRQ